MWDGKERRSEHRITLLPECTEIFKRIEQKVDKLSNIGLTVIFLLVIPILTLGAAWGSLNKQVEINTYRWEKVINSNGHIR